MHQVEDFNYWYHIWGICWEIIQSHDWFNLSSTWHVFPLIWSKSSYMITLVPKEWLIRNILSISSTSLKYRAWHQSSPISSSPNGFICKKLKLNIALQYGVRKRHAALVNQSQRMQLCTVIAYWFQGAMENWHLLGNVSCVTLFVRFNELTWSFSWQKPVNFSPTKPTSDSQNRRFKIQCRNPSIPLALRYKAYQRTTNNYSLCPDLDYLNSIPLCFCILV